MRSQSSTHALSSSVPGSTLLKRAMLSLGFSSGRVAPKDLQDDILNAEDIGAGQLKDFLTTRIQSDETKFHDSIRKNKLKTFGCLEANPINISNTTITLKSDQESFARLLVLKEKRGVSMKEILK